MYLFLTWLIKNQKISRIFTLLQLCYKGLPSFYYIKVRILLRLKKLLSQKNALFVCHTTKNEQIRYNLS